MKKNVALALMVIISISSCGLIKKTILMDQVVAEKEKLDVEKNPAKKYVITQQLTKRKIKIFDTVVKDITESSNIDYDFCVIVDVSTKKGNVECFVYTSNVKKISQLKKGVSKIDVKGEFGRFFSLLDDYYTKIEIINASIKIKD